MTPESDSSRIPFEEVEKAAPALGGMQPGNPVLQAALKLLRGESVGSVHPLQASLREPHPKRWRERLAAAWTLGRAPLSEDDSDSASGTLIEVLENGFRERTRSKLLRWACKTYAPALVIGVIAATVMLIDRHYYYDPPWLPMVFMIAAMVGTSSLFITIPLQSILEKRQNDKVRAAAAKRAASA